MKQCNRLSWFAFVWGVSTALLASLAVLGCAGDAGPGLELDDVPGAAGSMAGALAGAGELAGSGAAGAAAIGSAGSSSPAGNGAGVGGAAAAGGMAGGTSAAGAGGGAGVGSTGGSGGSAGSSGSAAAGSGGTSGTGSAGTGASPAPEGALPFNACKCQLGSGTPFITSRDWCDPPPPNTRTVNNLAASDVATCAERQAVNRATCCDAPRKIVAPATCKIPSGRVYTCEDFSTGADAATGTPASGQIVITWQLTRITSYTAYADCTQPQGSVCERGATCDVHLLNSGPHVTGVCL